MINQLLMTECSMVAGTETLLQTCVHLTFEQATFMLKSQHPSAVTVRLCHGKAKVRPALVSYLMLASALQQFSPEKVPYFLLVATSHPIHKSLNY
eukprot:1138867-Pelagomonas_calceolata.AAC.3